MEEVSAKIAQMPDFMVLDADIQIRIAVRITSQKAGVDMIKLIQAIRDRANGSRANLLSDVVTKLD